MQTAMMRKNSRVRLKENVHAERYRDDPFLRLSSPPEMRDEESRRFFFLFSEPEIFQSNYIFAVSIETEIQPEKPTHAEEEARLHDS